MPKEDFKRLKEGMKMVVERKRSMGLVMPSEEERSNPVKEARVAATYKKLMMRDTPDSFDSLASGTHYADILLTKLNIFFHLSPD